MNIFNQGIFELAEEKGISEKYTKLILLMLLLVLVKFVVIPVIEWQSEHKDNVDFYQLQYRDEASIQVNSEQIQKEIESLNDKIAVAEARYYRGSVTSNQVKLNDLITKKVESLKLSLASNNSRKLYEKDDIITVEYTVRVRGYALELQEFAYWLDNLKPKLLVRNLRFSSSRGAAAVELNVRFQQLILKEQIGSE